MDKLADEIAALLEKATHHPGENTIATIRHVIAEEELKRSLRNNVPAIIAALRARELVEEEARYPFMDDELHEPAGDDVERVGAAIKTAVENMQYLDWTEEDDDIEKEVPMSLLSFFKSTWQGGYAEQLFSEASEVAARAAIAAMPDASLRAELDNARERVEHAFEERLAIYRTKQEQADPFALDSYTRWEAIGYVIESIEILAKEMGIHLKDQA